MSFFKTKFQSHKQEWTTPDDLFKRLDKEFHFEIDLAADSKNRKCWMYFNRKINALKQTWQGVCWLNPPYGAKKDRLSDWVRKAFTETRKRGCTVVMLIPARTNTRWWHDYCMKAAEIRFINGRPKFGDAQHGLPQPLALIVFRSSSCHPRLMSYPAYDPE